MALPGDQVVIRDGLTVFETSPDYASREQRKVAGAGAWYRARLAEVPMKGPDPTLTPRERWLLRLSMAEYLRARREGRLTCEEYTRLLVRRAGYYRYMNHWTYRCYSRFELAVEAAVALDARAAEEGVEAIAPLFGLPIPIKGTSAVIDYPSGAGCGVLSGYTPIKNSAMTDRVIAANGIVFGTTNVPPFAHDIITKNAASGLTRSPYNHAFTVGGSSGGAGSAVASYMCPVAMSEDTGGSTRIPAWNCGVFGFDPARNHYDNAGNTAMSFTRDQIGVLARTMSDIITYDRVLMGSRHEADALHVAAESSAAARPAASLRVGVPQTPWVRHPELPKEWQEAGDATGEDGESGSSGWVLSPCVRDKYERAKAALLAAQMDVVEEEWPMVDCKSLGCEVNGVVKMLFEPLEVNGKPFDPINVFRASMSGQTAQWVREYLNAPVGIKDIAAEDGCNPGLKEFGDETQFRYYMGPYIMQEVLAYNAYFDAHGVDFILLPAGMVPTPDVSDAIDGSIKVPCSDGSVTDMTGFEVCWNHFLMPFKDLHIPKLLIPLGTSADGRPIAVQLWGRALPYEDMFDDARSSKLSVDFLHLASRVVEAIHADPSLCRVEPGLVADLFEAPSVP